MQLKVTTNELVKKDIKQKIFVFSTTRRQFSCFRGRRVQWVCIITISPLRQMVKQEIEMAIVKLILSVECHEPTVTRS